MTFKQTIEKINTTFNHYIPDFRGTAFDLSVVTLKVLFLVYLWTQYRMYQKLAELPSHSEDALRMSRVFLGAFIVFLVLFVYVIQWFSLSARQTRTQ
jgi:hypothetical protein